MDALSQELECTHCHALMSVAPAASSPVRYHHCPRCGGWCSSTYRDEVLRAGAGAQVRRRTAQGDAEQLASLKSRLERWLGAAEAQDPYRALGVSPGSSEEQIRARFHELAMRHHPDRGGDPEEMRRALRAYERARPAAASRAPALPRARGRSLGR